MDTPKEVVGIPTVRRKVAAWKETGRGRQVWGGWSREQGAPERELSQTGPTLLNGASPLLVPFSFLPALESLFPDYAATSMSSQ